MIRETASAEETIAFGAVIGGILQPGDLVCLNGDLGSGKTNLAKGIASGLGVCVNVTSPTYTILQIYAAAVSLYHFDLYRIECMEDLEDIGFEEYIYGQGVSIIEWADKFPAVLPDERLTIILRYGQTEQSRKIEVLAAGGRYRRRLEELKAACMY